MDTIESNKLIAEFMELPTEVFKSGKVNYYLREFNSGTWYEEHELSYDVSWDFWLMPVVKKILDISFQDEGDPEDFYSIRDCIPDRNHTYRAIVEFIKEYNKNKEE